MKEVKGCMNLQLFAELAPVEPPVVVAPPVTPPVVEPPVVEPPVVVEKTVSKKMFDDTASDLAKAKRELKELQNKGKTAEQISADELAEAGAKLLALQTEFEETKLKSNKSQALSAVAEAKAKISLKEDNNSFELLIDAITSSDSEKTTANSLELSKLALAIYEKGVNDVKSGDYNNMTNGVKTGDPSVKSTYGERIAKNNATADNSSIKDKYK